MNTIKTLTWLNETFPLTGENAFVYESASQTNIVDKPLRMTHKAFEV